MQRFPLCALTDLDADEGGTGGLDEAQLRADLKHRTYSVNQAPVAGRRVPSGVDSAEGSA